MTILATAAVALEKIPAVGAVLSTQDIMTILAIPVVYVIGRVLLKNKAMTVQAAVAEAQADVANALPVATVTTTTSVDAAAPPLA